MPKKEDSEEEKEEVSELEEKVTEEESEDISEEENSDEEINPFLDNFSFNEVSWPSVDSDSPVLEKITLKEGGPVFVGQISSRSQTGFEDEDRSDEFKYMPDFGNGEGTSYMTNTERVEIRPEKVNLSRVGRDASRPNFGEVEFKKSYTPEVSSSTREKINVTPERIDTGKAGREDLMETEDVKYEKYKPNLPDKGY